ncbi:MAG: PAS domain S-box protein [Terriglobales bacterium]
MDSPPIRRSNLKPIVAAAIYLIASCIWMGASIALGKHLSDDPDVLRYFGLVAGLSYVLISAAIVFFLIRGLNREKQVLEKTAAIRTAALTESEAQYRLFFESNPLPMWVFDLKTLRFLAVNEAAIRHYGYSREEFLAMSVLDIRPEEERQRLQERLSRPLRGREGAEVWKHRKKDGSIIDVEVTAHDLNFRGAEVELVLANDITARRQSEERLRQSQERFAKAFRSSPFGIAISSENESRFLDANPAFLAITGYERDQIVGRTEDELGLWTDPNERKLVLEQLNKGQHGTPINVRFRARSEQFRSIELVAERIQLDDQPCVLAIIHDVTDTKQLEQQFLQAQKMEAVGRLAAGIAHDFNNMLGVILGYCGVARERLDKKHPAQEYLLEIHSAGERAIALTRQLLAFSKQQVLEPRNLSLNSVVHHASRMLLRMIGEDISLIFRPTEPLGSVYADLSQLEQVLMNLAINARDAMPRGGKIVVETANVDLDERSGLGNQPVTPGRYVMLSVTDTGTGMDEATMAKAFEPFFTTKEVGKGTGLGLSTVYGIVKQSGGYIWASSEVGHGTTFKIYFPYVNQPPEVLTQHVQDTGVPSGTETVLVVEDEVALRNLTVHILKTKGYTVLSAENAARTLDLARRYDRKIDLLLTDVIMPDRSGPELVTEMRKWCPHLKVLYMSGYSKNAMVEQGVLGRDSKLIVKPFSTQALLAKMRTVLES